MIDRAALRDRIAQLDDEILRLAAERCRLGREVGQLKHAAGHPSVDYVQERRVLDRARDAASKQDLDPELAEDIIARLILGSVAVQERDRVLLTGSGRGKTAVVLGGAGRMGRWVKRFLGSHGYQVHVLDPVQEDAVNLSAGEALPAAELVICAMAPGAIAQQYDAWTQGPASQRPQGVVADIASIKTPLVDAISALRQAGCKVASFHPMFGPDLVALRGADVIVCQTGDAEATAVVDDLFAPTTAQVWHLPLEEHDLAMAEVLALAHATAIAFAAALDAPTTAPPVHSTTFGALERLARDVVHESPEVYYEIQARNPHAAHAVTRLSQRLAELQGAVAGADADAFRAVMESGLKALEQRDQARAERAPARIDA